VWVLGNPYVKHPRRGGQRFLVLLRSSVTHGISIFNRDTRASAWTKKISRVHDDRQKDAAEGGEGGGGERLVLGDIESIHPSIHPSVIVRSFVRSFVID